MFFAVPFLWFRWAASMSRPSESQPCFTQGTRDSGRPLCFFMRHLGLCVPRTPPFCALVLQGIKMTYLCLFRYTPMSYKLTINDLQLCQFLICKRIWQIHVCHIHASNLLCASLQSANKVNFGWFVPITRSKHVPQYVHKLTLRWIVCPCRSLERIRADTINSGTSHPSHYNQAPIRARRIGLSSTLVPIKFTP